jgi:hypothetical protein
MYMVIVVSDRGAPHSIIVQVSTLRDAYRDAIEHNAEDILICDATLDIGFVRHMVEIADAHRLEPTDCFHLTRRPNSGTE